MYAWNVIKNIEYLTTKINVHNRRWYSSGPGFDFFSPVHSSTRLELYAEKTDQIGSCMIIKGEIREGEKIVAKGGIKVFIIDIEQQKT